METIIWVGFSQSLFAGILISAKKKPQVPDRILAAWLFLLALEFLSCAFDINLWGIPLLSSSFLLFNPSFFLYIKSLTKPDFKLKYIQLLHLAPFFIFEVGGYLLQKKLNFQNFFVTDSSQWFRFSFSIASIISWLVYNTVSAIMVIKHRKKLENEFSNIENSTSLKWLFFIVVFYNLYCGFSVILGIFLVSTAKTELTQYIYNYSALLILIYILGFYGLRQLKIFNLPTNEAIAKETYQNSILSEERKMVIKKKVISYVEKKKAFLNPDINMNLLSESLDIPKHQITEVLNSELGKNFFRFINEYRVEEVKKMLNDPTNNYSIEAIGYECGFNSKSAFFTVFKTITGLTPLQFKNGMTPID